MGDGGLLVCKSCPRKRKSESVLLTVRVDRNVSGHVGGERGCGVRLMC
jgi:hypothetical protein